MSKQESSLSYAVRPTVIFKLCGQLSLVFAFLTLPSVVVSLVYGEVDAAGAYATVTFVFAAVGWRLNRLPRPKSLQANEAYVLAALAFLMISAAMTWPFTTAGLSPLDAFFEATSACTTTGLSASPQVENKPASFLFTRAWMQWYGGLGIVVFSIALIVRPGVLAKGLAAPESKEEELLSSTKTHARRVLIVYLILTGLAVAILWTLSSNFFAALTYALAAVSTGGFSPHNASLAGFGAAYLAPITILFGVAGSLPLYLYFRVYESGWRDFTSDTQVLTIGLASLVIAGLLTVLLGVGDYSWLQAVYHAPLLALSAQTTTGFSTTDVAQLNSASKLLLVFSMLIGGGAGSTAGGVKVLRLLILLRVIQQMIVRTCLPTHAVSEPHLSGRKLSELEIRDAFAVTVLFVSVIAISWFVFLATGEDALGSLFEIVSATGTVGLSAGICRPELPALLKIVLCIDMLMGRLEVFAWLVVLHRGTWFGKRAD